MERFGGRVEFLAVQEDVVELLRKGYGYTMIYNKLKNESKITMCYQTFYGYVKKIVMGVEPKKRLTATMKIKSSYMVLPVCLKKIQKNKKRNICNYTDLL